MVLQHGLPAAWLADALPPPRHDFLDSTDKRLKLIRREYARTKCKTNNKQQTKHKNDKYISKWVSANAVAVALKGRKWTGMSLIKQTIAIGVANNNNNVGHRHQRSVIASVLPPQESA